MRIPTTTRQRTQYAASLCLIIAAAIVALSSTYLVDEQHPSRRSSLAPNGHAAITHLHRDALRVERARQRTGPHSAYILPAAHRVPVDGGVRILAITPRPWQSLDPVHVASGRSPPLRLS